MYESNYPLSNAAWTIISLPSGTIETSLLRLTTMWLRPGSPAKLHENGRVEYGSEDDYRYSC